MALITTSELEEQAAASPTISLNGEAAGRLPLNGHAPRAVKVPGYPLRRPVEVLLALVGISVVLPASFLIAALIWLDDRGPVFVRQTRVGRDGRLFHLFKFRTMRDQDADDVP